MRTAAIAGGGVAGIAAAAALADAGFRVILLESRPYLGGRASSYALPGRDSEVIDNCQHILLKCCVNLLDLYRRLGVEDQIEFHGEFHYLEPGGRRSVLRSGFLPAPLHFSGSFASLRFLSPGEKLEAARGLLALRREYGRRSDLDSITMQQWLEEKRQSPRTISRFWAPVLVSAVNEELDRMAALHGFKVFRLAFLSARDAYQMGVPRVPLGEIHSAERLAPSTGAQVLLRRKVTGLHTEGRRIRALLTDNGPVEADVFVSALPFEPLRQLAPGLLDDWSVFEHSPIAGIHLWFDRPVTDLPHAVLLDSPFQWFFNKSGGRYLQLVVSASRFLETWPRQQAAVRAFEDLCRYLPEARRARLERYHVVKEIRATFSARPGLAARRPRPETRFENLFLAGDWTDTGWPSTMEGAARSGYRAAEAVCHAFGQPRKFLLPDIA
ncbi:MAG: phytoene dehydrogenase [Bryobacteraceae bacterium]|nr:MAG: phytoene dehydrogenase [Bryobacteraceae bacterium]